MQFISIKVIINISDYKSKLNIHDTMLFLNDTILTFYTIIAFN